MKLTSTYIMSWLYLLIYCGHAQTDVSLRVNPDRTQFFQAESISLSCEEEEGRSVSGWSVRRHTKERGNGTCNNEFGEIKRSSCDMNLYPWDEGVYWCQSDSEELSDVVNIMISEGDVFLESPVPPVMEGSDVTLRCWSKDNTTNPTSDLQADFYTNGSLIRTESTGQMTIHNVNKSDEGFYKCNISGLGESAERWMEVRNSSSTPDPTSESEADPPISLPHAIIHVLLVIPWVVSTILYIAILRDRARDRAAAARRRDINDVIMEVAV